MTPKRRGVRLPKRWCSRVLRHAVMAFREGLMNGKRAFEPGCDIAKGVSRLAAEKIAKHSSFS